MRDQFLQSPRLSRIGRRGGTPLSAYASANGAVPTVAVHDLRGGLAFTGDSPVALAEAYSYANISGTPLTMVDSDAVTKYQPHNLQVNSENFGAATWGKGNVTVAVDVTADPDGGATADKIAETAVDNVHYVQDIVPVTDPSVLGLFMKAGERSWGLLRASFTTSFFDLENGVTGTGGGLTDTTIADAGGGWYLCKGKTAQSNFIIRPGPTTGDGATTHLGVDGSGIYAWGGFAHLQGMVDNPARGDEYVPNTSATSPAFLARLNHHVDLGGGYENGGLLFDSANESYVTANVPDGTYDIEVVGAGGTITQLYSEAVSNGFNLGVDGTIAEVRFFEAGSIAPVNLLPSEASSFDTAAGWTVPASWSVSGGEATHVTTGAAEFLDYAVDVPAGTALIAFRVTETNDAGGITAQLANGAASAGVVSGSLRNYAYLVASPGSDTLRLNTMATWAGKIDEVEVYDVTAIEALPADVYILAGQSNMVGANATPIDIALDTQNPWITYMDGASGTALLAGVDPIQHSGIVSSGVGPGMAAAKGMRASLAAGRRIVLVAVAENATTLVGSGADWEPGIGAGYLNAVSRINAALALLPAGSAVKGMFWSQGESDNTPTVGVDYPPAFQALLAQLKTDLGLASLPTVILGPTPEGDTANRLAIAQATLDETSGDANATVEVKFSAGPAGMAMAGDDVHFSPAGNRLRGANAAVLMAGLLA